MIDPNVQTFQVLLEVAGERERQRVKWGNQHDDAEHTMHDWAGFIRRRTSELCGGGQARERELWLEIAALAVAAMESYDRKRAQP